MALNKIIANRQVELDADWTIDQDTEGKILLTGSPVYGATSVLPKSEIESLISASVNVIEWQDSALSYIADNTAAPPTEVSGDRYVLSHDGGAPNAAWDGASAGDIVEFNGTTWDAITPTTGMFIGVDDDTTGVYYWGGSSWGLQLWENTVQATETVAGKAEIATDAETAAGTSDTTIVTPQKLRTEIIARRSVHNSYPGAGGAGTVINIDPPAVGSVTLDSGASGSVDDITVNAVSIMSGAESFDTDLATTAANVAANINAEKSSPNYFAKAVGAVITITAQAGGTAANGFAVVSSTTTIAATDGNMAGGVVKSPLADDWVDVYRNGQLMSEGFGYTISGSDITLQDATGNNTLITVKYLV